ncbi:MAG: arsenate reductase [Chitinophagales bacterium]|jgi:arsenate reductase
MKTILVLCTGNSCRSQMAEGYLRHFANGKAKVFSAGIETHGVNKMAIEVMNLDGIDISSHTSNNIDEYRDIQIDFVITVCDHAKENCPYFPSLAVQFHRNFSDPSKLDGSRNEKLSAFIKTRDEIKSYAEDFIQDKF